MHHGYEKRKRAEQGPRPIGPRDSSNPGDSGTILCGDIEPEMAGQLLERKLKHIQSTGASIVATGNSGCQESTRW
jgi:hypothetical protein